MECSLCNSCRICSIYCTTKVTKLEQASQYTGSWNGTQVKSSHKALLYLIQLNSKKSQRQKFPEIKNKRHDLTMLLQNSIVLLLTRDTICFLHQSAQVMVRRRGQGTITLLPVHHHCRPLPRAGVGRLLTCNNRNQKLMLPSHCAIWSHHTKLPDWEKFQIWIQTSLTACV